MKIFNLTGKVALVTGGSKGLGKAMARGLAEAGADIVISSRHEDELKPALAEILEGTQSQGQFFVADMNKRDQVAAPGQGRRRGLWARRHPHQQRRHQQSRKPIDEIKDEDWDRVMEINLTRSWS